MKTYDGNMIRRQSGFVWDGTKYKVTVMSVKKWFEYDLKSKLDAAITADTDQEKRVVTEQINFIEASSDIPVKALWEMDATTINFLFKLSKGEDPENVEPIKDDAGKN
ncbi:hypothetical protein LF599_07550 [Pseudodesulfovibrio thermohalotolerans]|uniref:hypothetical protein n=1 Tax=Pseudodesulfovibrio thermohalotolerans TaxID=2880651 RepID=UPI0022B9F151|nr:hypothetical protein [Pseudodesulfovibrio thermohalotolerans]WFS64009.1 hypothetical protein LF599_07550 [Pseudodesulfovibrio thermohalotolerans]